MRIIFYFIIKMNILDFKLAILEWIYYWNRSNNSKTMEGISDFQVLNE